MSSALEEARSCAALPEDAVYVVTIGTADDDSFTSEDLESKHAIKQTIRSTPSDTSILVEKVEGYVATSLVASETSIADAESEPEQDHILVKSSTNRHYRKLSKYAITILTTIIALSSLILTALALWPALRSRTTEIRSLALEEWTSQLNFIQYCEDKVNTNTTTVSDACVLALSNDLGPPPVVGTATRPFLSREPTGSATSALGVPAASSTIDPNAPYQNTTVALSASSSALAVVLTSVSPPLAAIAIKTAIAPAVALSTGVFESYTVVSTDRVGRGWITLVSSSPTNTDIMASVRTNTIVKEEN